jgi:hypothetical protein
LNPTERTDQGPSLRAQERQSRTASRRPATSSPLRYAVHAPAIGASCTRAPTWFGFTEAPCGSSARCGTRTGSCRNGRPVTSPSCSSTTRPSRSRLVTDPVPCAVATRTTPIAKPGPPHAAWPSHRRTRSTGSCTASGSFAAPTGGGFTRPAGRSCPRERSSSCPAGRCWSSTIQSCRGRCTGTRAHARAPRPARWR